MKAFRRDLFTTGDPEAVRPVRMSGRPVDEETVRDVYAYRRARAVLLRHRGRHRRFLNIGPAFGVAGPFDSYDPIPYSTKLFMVIAVWAGRIEITPVLVLFTRAYWRG